MMPKELLTQLLKIFDRHCEFQICGRQWQDEIELQRQMQEEQQHFNPIRGPRLASNSKADVDWQDPPYHACGCRLLQSGCRLLLAHAVDGGAGNKDADENAHQHSQA